MAHAQQVAVGIVSGEQDLHAHAVVQELLDLGQHAYLIAADTLAAEGYLSWWGPPTSSATISTFHGDSIDIATLDLLWWRRVNQPQARLAKGIGADDAELISNEWRAAVIGSSFDAFHGVWVNFPWNDTTAGNKLIQLRAAQRVGFNVPRSLVSTHRDHVLDFCRSVGGEVIAKKLVGAPPTPLATVGLALADLNDDVASIAICPTMYQELVRGRQHLRVNCFGSSIHAFSIESDHLDWRRDLSAPIHYVELEPAEKDLFQRLLRSLGLKMAVMDAKRAEDGSLVWIELNPQGQFLFCEGLTGYGLTRQFAQFLIETARAEGSPG